jgi:hypothetical protein
LSTLCARYPLEAMTMMATVTELKAAVVEVWLAKPA